MAAAPDRPLSASDPVRVLYIGGAGRSGSTLLDLMLGQLPDFFAGGELKYLWERGLARNELCGCGARFLECPFWSQVGTEAFGGWDNIDVDDVRKLEVEVDRHARVPLMSAPWMSPSYRQRMERFSDILESLYRGIQTVSGAKVIVDSTKRPSSAFLLRHVPSVDLRFVHLVRDSRGVAYSWSKRVVRPEVVKDVEYMPSYSPLKGGARWFANNSLFHVLGAMRVPGLRLRYESLVRSPESELRRIVQHALGHPEDVDLGFLGGGGVELTTNHTVAGNPVRLRKDQSLVLGVDNEWKTKMDPRQRRVILLLTWPLLLRYGYIGSAAPNGSGGDPT
jgi:hypothetical protein